MTNKPDDEEKVMKLVIEWYKMHTLCMNREWCDDCPYFFEGVCTKWTTHSVMSHAARKFIKILRGRKNV